MKFKIVKSIEAKNLVDAIKNEAKGTIVYIEEVLEPRPPRVSTQAIGFGVDQQEYDEE